jgi:hypothetical protein
MRLLLLFLLLAASASAQTTGIASRYPRDRGIRFDPDVLLADDFESYTSTAQLTNNWSGVGGVQNMRIATEPGNFFSGGAALEMKLPVSSNEVNDVLRKRFSTGHDVVFVRTYCKFDPLYHLPAGNHNGMRLSAKYPGAGIKPLANGTGFFLFLLQNDFLNLQGETDPGYTHIYAYWPRQRSSFGDHWYPNGEVLPYSSTIGDKGDWLAYPQKYPDFKPYANFVPQRNRWYCYELMVKANTPGVNNGRVKCWINGNVVCDFPDINMRSISTLKLDEAVVLLGATQSKRVNKKWYDNIVIATKYIGPMRP